MPNRTPSEQERLVIEARRNGKGIAEIARFVGIDRSTVANIIKRENAPLPRIGRPPTCDINHEAFDTISPTSAYWMGYLIADGSIAFGGGAPQLILDIAEKDRAHIEKFRSFLGSTHAIVTVTHKAGIIPQRGKVPTAVRQRQSVAFRVRSKRLVEALIAKGMVAKKGPERAPNTDDLTYSPDFWRGAIDGDGTVGVYADSRGYEYATLILCGHLPLLEKYQMFLTRQGLATNITDTSSGIFQVRMIGLGALAVIRLLYADAVVALDRKLQRAREAIANGR